MFRIPSANFIRGAIPAELQSKQHMDLAECIFGTADKGLGYLKGRVFSARRLPMMVLRLLMKFVRR